MAFSNALSSSGEAESHSIYIFLYFSSYDSSHKFDCGCGWPGYWTNIEGAVAERSETDGSGRVEIVCAKCGSHLGHVFRGEGMG